MPRCKLCRKNFKLITNTHLTSVHKITLKDYAKKFGTRDCGFFCPNLLPKNDPRYKKWKESLRKRPAPWNKGHSKETHSGVAKISATFRKKRIDNFAKWRKEMARRGLIKIKHPTLKKSGNLAELIGVILGDGYIGQCPRTESLIIVSNSNNPGFIQRYSDLIKKVFNKSANIHARKTSNCTNIRIYQKDISKRLSIPAGAKKNKNIEIPQWILENRKYLKRYLRGLYEAEGSFCVHKPTYTYKFIFSNRNKSLLNNVYYALEVLGFHPHRSKDKIQISKREEVYKIKDLLKFRQY